MVGTNEDLCIFEGRCEVVIVTMCYPVSHDESLNYSIKSVVIGRESDSHDAI